MLGFSTRKIRRLQPALAAFCLVTGMVACLFNALPSDAIGAGIAVLLREANIYTYHESTQCFEPATDPDPFTYT